MKTSLELKKPLTFIKVQTTGENPKVDRIIELCFSKIMPDGTEKEGTKRINPGIEIPAEASKINGITTDMVKDKPTFETIAGGLHTFLKDSDFAGFNIKDFDLQFLIEEFNRAGIAFNLVGKNVIDLKIFYCMMDSRTFKDALRVYLGQEVPKEESITSGYSVKYSRELMESMLSKHVGQEVDGKVVNKDVSELSDIFNYNKGKKPLDNAGNIVLNEDNRPIFTIGKYKGQLVSDSLLNDKKYYHWILDESTFPADTKDIIKKIVQKAKNAEETASSQK